MSQNSDEEWEVKSSDWSDHEPSKTDCEHPEIYNEWKLVCKIFIHEIITWNFIFKLKLRFSNNSSENFGTNNEESVKARSNI